VTLAQGQAPFIPFTPKFQQIAAGDIFKNQSQKEKRKTRKNEVKKRKTNEKNETE